MSAPAAAASSETISATTPQPTESQQDKSTAATTVTPWTDDDTQNVQSNFKAVAARVEAVLAERKSLKPPPFPGADTSPVRLVAVSKTKPAEAVKAAYDIGCRIFGENYVQEIVAKAPVLPQDIQWHMIGHLQSNKADEIVLKVPSLYAVETVDSAKLATKLDKAVEKSPRKDRPLVVFVQVNTSGEESKFGVEPTSEELTQIPIHIRDNCPFLKFAGLMTIGMPDFTSKPENFVCLQNCRKKVAEALKVDETSLEMSMGMSGDYPQAITAGSTNVRVGSTIFGAREKKNMASLEAAAVATPGVVVAEAEKKSEEKKTE